MPILINKYDAEKIAEIRMPAGKFFYPLGDKIMAMDNTTYDAWIEEFDTVRECLEWLRK